MACVANGSWNGTMKNFPLAPQREKGKRLFLALWIPFLPTDRLRRVALPDTQPELPLVVTDRVANALRLSAVDAKAAKLGLFPGMALTDARARVEGLEVVKAEPELDASLLNRLAYWCERYTPLIAFDQPYGLILDITGCAHLFGGVRAMGADVIERIEKAGLSTKAAVSESAFSARLLARNTKGGVFSKQKAIAVLPRLPISALDLVPATETGLKRAGLKTIGDVMALPRAALTARFGPDLATKLDRLFADEHAPISPLRIIVPFSCERKASEPLATMELVEVILHELANELFEQLAVKGRGATLIEASFFRVDGEVRHIHIETGQALRDTQIFLRLMRERLNALTDPLDAGFGFDLIRLAALRSAPIVQRQTGLDQHEENEAGLSQLVDRLSARLGPNRVLISFPRDTHMPERAFFMRPALHVSRGSETGDDTMPCLPGDPPVRPIKLFHPPQPIEATAEIPDNPPGFFQWRRVRHQVRLAEGPERIEEEWWLSIGKAPRPLRDYYRVEDENGQRFWIFREGSYGDQAQTRWFLHGLFA